jgi:hypothetical protein
VVGKQVKLLHIFFYFYTSGFCLTQNSWNPSSAYFLNVNVLMNDSVCTISTDFNLYVFKHRIVMIVWNNFLSIVTIHDHLCGLVISPGSIPGTTRFSEK